jgi:hypothetical protein
LAPQIGRSKSFLIGKFSILRRYPGAVAKSLFPCLDLPRNCNKKKIPDASLVAAADSLRAR